MDINEIRDFLRGYDGEALSIMEVCGTHTASISENAIPSLLSEKINLISGPGCPVCVTVASYIDRLCELSFTPDTCVVTFGDMMRVPGSELSLTAAKALGGRVEMVYSPFEILDLARENAGVTYIFAAVGFETTTPIYAVLLDKIIAEGVENIKLLTALKTMPRAIEAICEMRGNIDGFIAPGNVSVITGSDIYKPLAEKYGLPFVVSGFSGQELLATIYTLVKLRGRGEVVNLYKSAVTNSGNEKARELVSKYFTPCNASWRGLGVIDGSGMTLRDEYLSFDAGSRALTDDKIKSGCSCGRVITGEIKPTQCPLFKTVCTPEKPQGACMVSNEGACFHYFINDRK